MNWAKVDVLISISPGTDNAGGLPAASVITPCAVLLPAVALIVMFCVCERTPPIAWKVTADCPRLAVINEGTLKAGLLVVKEIPKAP